MPKVRKILPIQKIPHSGIGFKAAEKVRNHWVWELC